LLSRTSVSERGVIARAVAFLGLFMLVAPILLLMSSRSADAVVTLCLPKAEETACIAGTMGSRADPKEGVDVILTKPDGTTETQTTEKDGKFSFTVTEAGNYLVGVDPDTLDDGDELRPPADANLRGPDGTIKVDNVQLGRSYGPVLTVRAADFDDSSSTIDEVLQSSVNGLRLGLLLALASVGLSLIYGTTGLSNFAHAEQVTLGGMLGYLFINAGLSIGPLDIGPFNLLVGGIIVIILCGFSGWLQDRILWQPLRRRGLGLTQLMIVTIGLSLALQYTFQYTVGSRTVRVVVENPTVREFGSVRITNQSLVAMAIAAVVLLMVGFVLLRTRIGRATRAVSDNPALAQASGIDTDKVIRLVWTSAMALSGLSGILYALVTNGIKWDTGLQILLLLFAAVTLGGLGTAFGALIGSIVIGLIVELSPLVIPGDFKYAAALLILILLLLVRPQGLLGRAQRVG
jgi:branched-chain amino acid transport system permease protein